MQKRREKHVNTEISAVLYGAVRCYLEGELFAVVIDLYNVRYAAEHSP
jgi:hypothetical protein